MLNFFRNLFATDFMAHGYCLRLPEVILLHQISDLVIALSYFLIPVGLVYVVRQRRDLLVFPWMFWLFGLFILSCGATHVLSVYMLWHPAYRLDGVVKAITAAASFPTAILLLRSLPRLRLLPSPEQLRRKNRELAREIQERQRAEQEVQRLNAELEHRVQERTAELEQSNLQLRRALHDLEQFAWSASHDLREPLRNISIFGDILQNRHGASLGTEGRVYLNHIIDGASRMDGLLSDLVSYSSLSSPDSDQPPSADAQETLAMVLADLEATLRDSQASVDQQPLPTVAVPPTQLRRLFQNLISNALKYRHPNRPPQIRISAQPDGPMWHFQVADNGIGIAPQYHEVIFQIFRRLHTRAEFDGNGIGLAMCQRIAERCGGRIWVESAEGEGATFHFTLPAGESLP